MSLESIATNLAILLHKDGFQNLQEASDELQAAAVRMYLDAMEWDIEITLSAIDVRDRERYGRSYQSLIEQELYAKAEAALEPLVAIELERLQRDLNISAAVDAAIDQLKEKRNAA